MTPQSRLVCDRFPRASQYNPEWFLANASAGADDGVFPLWADARALPFPPDFFDAIVCVDSFFYFGTDDLY